MTELKAGLQLASVVCDTRVVVVRTDDASVRITCGGADMVPADAVGPPSGSVTEPGPTLIGKRYVDEAGSVELLCTKAGEGRLAVGGSPMEVMSAKPLPSSD